MKNKIKSMIYAGLLPILASAGISAEGAREKEISGLEQKVERKLEQSEEVTEANRLLRAFPDKIPGAKRVEKCEAPGARYTLVHIRQVHGLNKETSLKLDEDLRKYTADSTNRSQEDIYRILSHLLENNGLKVVYAEGKSLDSKFNNEHFDEIFRDKSAVRRLLDEGKIIVGPAETEPADYRIERLAREVKGPRDVVKMNYELMDGREYAVMDILSRRNEVDDSPIKHVVFGAAHNWGLANTFIRSLDGVSYDVKSWDDNISKWNAKFPEKKFSLIVVTPESYIESKDSKKD